MKNYGNVSRICQNCNARGVWRCRNCGCLHQGIEAPADCPACDHPQAHFELLGENW